MTATQVQKQFGVSPRQLEYWTKKGIISHTVETNGARSLRIYPPPQVDTIRRLIWLLSQGLTLQGAVNNLPRIADMEAKRGSPMPPPPKPEPDPFDPPSP